MAPEFDPLDTTWSELEAQETLTRSLGQRTCGSTTHVDRFGTCPWCGACL